MALPRPVTDVVVVCTYGSSTGSSNIIRHGSTVATEIKVSVSKVSSADGCSEGWEVAGTSSQVNSLLQQVLARGSAGGVSPMWTTCWRRLLLWRTGGSLMAGVPGRSLRHEQHMFA